MSCIGYLDWAVRTQNRMLFSSDSETSFLLCFFCTIIKNLYLCKVFLTVCFVFALHEDCACLEQVRWIYATTELATSGFTKDKTRGKGESSPGILNPLLCCWRCPLTCSKNVQDQRKKKNACTHIYFFSNVLIKMTYPQIKILSKLCYFLQRNLSFTNLMFSRKTKTRKVNVV